MIAALYVDERGPYTNLPGVDVWGISRDARLYRGPHPVIAHPPCERWGSYASGGPSARRVKQDDGGCFAAALAAVRRWGGVLEHPAYSAAWKTFGLPAPPSAGGWIRADTCGWTCRVDQGQYGHRARKATWLYAARVALPDLQWARARNMARIDAGYHTAAERAAAKVAGSLRSVELLSKRERRLTPELFRDLLIQIVRGA